MVDEKTARELVDRWVEEVYVKQTAENLDEILTNDWVVHEPGKNYGIREVKEDFRKQFAEGKVESVVDKLIISGDLVVTVWSERFTSYSTRLETFGASITIDRIRDRKFAETWYIRSDKPWIK